MAAFNPDVLNTRPSFDPAGRAKIASAMNAFADLCHAEAEKWWRDPTTGEYLVGRNEPEMIALIHSEVSEGLEHLRKGTMDDKLPHRKGIEVELADAMIRIGDMAAALRLDLGGAIVEKIQFNRDRADHQLESRRQAGGKAF